MHNENTGSEAPAAQELYRSPDSGLYVRVSNELNDADKESVWTMIQTGFQTLNNKAGVKQDMTPEEFEADVNSTDVYHYVAYDSSGMPVGFLNLHWGLDSVRWAPDSMKERMNALQKLIGTAEPVYVGTLVIPEELRAGEVTPALVRACYSHWEQLVAERGDMYCFFDCAEANYPRLPHLLQFLARPSKRDGFPGVALEMNEIGTVFEDTAKVLEPGAFGPYPVNIQHYFSMHLSQGPGNVLP